MSKVLATMRRDLPVDLDVAAEASQAPDRSKLREVFREFELRDPLRRLEEFLGAEQAAPAPVASTEVSARVRGGTLADVARLEGGELVLAVRPPEIPEGELLAVDTSWRFAVAAAGEVLTGMMDDPAQLVAAAGERPVVAYDAKAFGVVPPNLVHDALLGAYLLEPARRGYPLRELLEERGLGAPGVEDELAAEALLIGELSAWQREQIVARDLVTVMQEIELPLVPVLRLDGARGRAAEHRSHARDHRARAREVARSSSRSGAWPRRSSSSARRSSSARSSSRSSACRRSAAARRASRPTRACCRRSATSTRSSR